MTRRLAALATVAAAGLLVAGCGKSSPSVNELLHDQARAVRADLVAGNVGDARGDLARLRASVRDANVSGFLEDDQAARILDAARAVEDSMTASTAPPTTTTAPPPPAPGKDEHRKGGGKKKD